jgi:putrescine transport system permease protein
MVLTRFGRSAAHAVVGLTTAPLVMPEVITGLSLLLLFVTMEQLLGWPEGAA